MRLIKNIDIVFVFLVMYKIFYFVVFIAESDMPAHAGFARLMLAEGKLFSNIFLMYFLVNLFSGFSGTIYSTNTALVFLLSVSNTAKYVIVKKVFEQWCNYKWAMVSSLALLFVFIVPILFFLNFLGSDYGEWVMYIGYYVPNVWHNSTFICMMPFAILTYLLSINQFDNFDETRNGLIILFVIIGVLIKPSFFFLYVIAYPILIFAKYRWKREFLLSLIPIFCGCICLLYVYLSIFNSSEMIFEVSDENRNEVVIDIFSLFTVEFWKERLLKLGISLTFPIVFFVVYWKKIKKDYEFWFVLVMLIVALGVVWCCHETGSRATHGNFSWQVVSAMWFVYYYMLKTIIIYDNTNGVNELHFGRRGKVFIILYFFHVLVGLYYIYRYFIIKVYY